MAKTGLLTLQGPPKTGKKASGVKKRMKNGNAVGCAGNMVWGTVSIEYIILMVIWFLEKIRINLYEKEGIKRSTHVMFELLLYRNRNMIWNRKPPETNKSQVEVGLSIIPPSASDVNASTATDTIEPALGQYIRI